MDRYIRYTIKSAYGEHRAYIVDDNQRAAIEDLTGAKTLTRRAAKGLKSLGLELEYVGDVSYDDDPIYPHGHHLSQAVLDTIRANKLDENLDRGAAKGFRPLRP